MLRKMYVAASCILLAVATIASARTPRQFEAWAKHAPADWSQRATTPDDWFEAIPNVCTTMPPFDAASRQLGWVAFSKSPYDMVFPMTAPFPGEVTQTLRAFGTPGEYATVTFSVRGLRKLEGLTVTTDTLASEQGQTIPTSHVDLRVVRYMPTPATFIDLRYRPEGVTKADNRYVIAPAFMEAFDAVNIEQDTTRRFWITIKIPDHAPAGVYRAPVALRDKSGNRQELTLLLRVLPFKLKELDPKRMSFSILYNGTDKRTTTHGRGLFTENLPKHFVDMAENGMNSCGYFHMDPVYKLVDGNLVVSFDEPAGCSAYSMNEIMRHYIDAGLTGPLGHQKGPYVQLKSMITFHLGHKIYTPEFDEAFREITRQIMLKAKEANWPELVYFMGDEPGSKADRHKMGIYYGKIAREVAPNLRRSNFFNGDWGGTKDWLIMKDGTDICCSNYVNEGLIAERRLAGYDDQWIYNGGSGGGRRPVADRFFYGFHAWKVEATGVTQYIYQKIKGDAFNHMDTHDKVMGKHGPLEWIYTYPTPDGPLPTPCWQGVRAGIYDWRYLWTLESLIQQARDSQSPAVQAAIAQARKEMISVMNEFPYDYQTQRREEVLSDIQPASLDVYRWRIARQILNLHECIAREIEQNLH